MSEPPTKKVCYSRFGRRIKPYPSRVSYGLSDSESEEDERMADSEGLSNSPKTLSEFEVHPDDLRDAKEAIRDHEDQKKTNLANMTGEYKRFLEDGEQEYVPEDSSDDSDASDISDSSLESTVDTSESDSDVESDDTGDVLQDIVDAIDMEEYEESEENIDADEEEEVIDF